MDDGYVKILYSTYVFSHKIHSNTQELKFQPEKNTNIFLFDMNSDE